MIRQYLFQKKKRTSNVKVGEKERKIIDYFKIKENTSIFLQKGNCVFWGQQSGSVFMEK